MTDLKTVFADLDLAERSIAHVRACLLGASQGTATADRWEMAVDHMVSPRTARRCSARTLAGVRRIWCPPASA